MAAYSAFFSSGLNASRSPSPVDFHTPSPIPDDSMGSGPSDATNTAHARSRSRSSSQSSVGKTLRKRKSSLTLGGVRPSVAAIKSPVRNAGNAFSKHMSAMSLSAVAAPNFTGAGGEPASKTRIRSGSLGGALRPRRARAAGALPPPNAPLPPLPPMPMIPGSAPPYKAGFTSTDLDKTPTRGSMSMLDVPSLMHRPRSYQGTTSPSHPGMGSRGSSFQAYTSSMSQAYHLPSTPSSPGLPSSPMRPDSPVHPSSPTPGNICMTTPEKRHMLSIPASGVQKLTTPERERWGRARAYSIENGYRISEDMEL